MISGCCGSDGDESIVAEREALCRILADKGIKSTKQRLAVMGELAENGAPMTAEEIFLRAHDRCENLSLSTVYRILDVLCKNGMAARTVLTDGGKAVFELTTEGHVHNLICIKCHKVMPLEGCLFARYENSIEESTGYKISSHKLEVYGICPKCGK